VRRQSLPLQRQPRRDRGRARGPYIPFKANSRGVGKSDAWRRLWHTFEARNDEFLAHYHQRSNVESTFSMVKRKFGASVRAKSLPAQVNEVLLKCLCHNLSVLVHAIHELGIEPSFWARLEVA
jgi:transposase